MHLGKLAREEMNLIGITFDAQQYTDLRRFWPVPTQFASFTDFICTQSSP